MKFKLTALLLALLLVVLFGACGKKTSQVVVVTNESGETETDAQGQAVTELVPATEATGAPVTDQNGETVTDAQGAPVTNPPAEAPAEDDAPPPEDAPIESIEGEDIVELPPAEPETPVELFNDALLELFTDEQKSDQWFSAYGMDAANNGVDVFLSMPQSGDSTDDAFRLAASYFESVKTTAQSAGLTLSSYEFTVLSDGATIGVYTTSDGATYTALENGETSQRTVQ